VHLGLSPDDTRVAFTGIECGQLEPYLMEGFLSGSQAHSGRVFME
jgi:hypothetical protein